MRIRTFLKPFSFLPAIFLMYMIFSFSSMEADVSSNVSYKVSTVLVKAADNLFDMGLDSYQISYFATKIHGVTRKLAHMTEFFALAIAVSFPLYVYGLRGILLMLLAGGFCIAFACGDEYHQSFVSGRSPSSRDVLIDSIGVVIGIILVRIIGWTGRMTLFRPVKPKKEASQIPDFSEMSRKERKQWKKQQRAMKKAGYDPEQMPPYSNAPFQNGPYPGQFYQNSSFSGTPYPNGNFQMPPYSNGANEYQQNAPYSNGAFPNGSYPTPPSAGGYYPNESYPGGPYPGQAYPPNGCDPYSYPPQYAQQEAEEDYSSDELSEDMPLSHLLKHRK